MKVTSTTKQERLQVSVHTLMLGRDCRTRLLLRLAGMMDASEPPPGAVLSLLAGSWGHKGLAAWLSEQSWEEAIAPYETLSQQLGIVSDRRAYDNLKLILNSVIMRYTPLDRLPFELIDPKTTEVGFVAPLGVVDKVPVDLIGYIDKLVADKRTGRKMPLEHKFTGKLDDAFVARFAEYDPQTTAYMLAAETVLGEPIGDTWVNAISLNEVPGSERKCPKHGVPYAECGPDGTIRDPHVKQVFIPARRTPEQIEEFRRMALDTVERYILPVARALKKHGPEVAMKTPRDGIFTGACDYCDFRRWCLTANRGPTLFKTMLKVNDILADDRILRSGLVEVEA